MTTVKGFQSSLATLLDCKVSDIAVREDITNHTVEVGFTNSVLKKSMFTQEQVEKVILSFTPVGVRYTVTVVDA